MPESLSTAWREAAWDAFADGEPEIRASVQAAADAAVQVFIDRAIDRAKTHGDLGAVELMYAVESSLLERGEQHD